MELSLIFKTLGDDVRIRILGLLLKKELCVCDIESVLEISQANASRHLAKMKITGILSSRKNAQWVYYAVNKKFIEEHSELIESFNIELKKRSDHKSDLKSLSAIKKKVPKVKC
jgi:ArsR family transcriptional regulator